MDPLVILDGHNDTLLDLRRSGDRPARSFFEPSTNGHIDLPRAREGRFGGGFFAVFVPRDPTLPWLPDDGFELTADGYTMPLPPPLELGYAQQTAMGLIADLFRLEAESTGRLHVVRRLTDLTRALDDGVLVAILHLEGAEAIDPEFNALEVFYQAGLRSLGLVWSRPNVFGCGVPFRFPSSPDTGPGLTDAGRALVRACNRLGIMLDLSHLNERGFWDVAAISDAPLVATHSNAHALCPVARNLTDRQLDAIRDSQGIVGLCFDVSMLRPDGYLEPDTPLDIVVQHVDYLVERVGIDCVGFGSDFDGATIPAAIGDVSGLPGLVTALREHGYDADSLRKLTHGNWLRVLGQTWREE